jgi:hypothetical protein
MENLTMDKLEAGLDMIRQSPKNVGQLELIVTRPNIDERNVLNQGVLDPEMGLVGDSWSSRHSSRNEDGSLDYDVQITLMNARVIALLAQSKERWSLAGDQLFVDLDLSLANLPPGTRLKIGEAQVEVTVVPHTGCQKFKARFGQDALVFVNGPAYRHLRMRGINARVITPGAIQTGDAVQVVHRPVA